MERRRHGAARVIAATVAVAISCMVLAITGATAQPAQQGSDSGSDPRIPVQEQTVTLLTGDQVVITELADGSRGMRVDPAPRRAGMTFIEQRMDDGRLRVIPVDALELVASGRLDPRLFDVTGLIEQGYDDAAADEVALIVRYDDGPRAASAVVTELTQAGGRVERALPSVNGAAVRVPKRTTDELWDRLTDTAAADALSQGIASVSLDGKVAAMLDESVPLVGAPAAWEAGYTGAGARVVVLDSGIDIGHPDVADKISVAADFTDSDSGIVDIHGHGTHVASIVAGNGAASGGQYTGVAPDVELVIGKVLDDSGQGDESWVIAGMEWAVDEDASVVNLSLGGCATDGFDPLSDALNSLAEQSGTLFVAAAGNHPASMPCAYPGAVSSPAAADHAVAVGSVNKAGKLSDFSNTGPRAGDGAVKPELTAPGESIVAARAEGTLGDVAVGTHYARLSGTSMAAPHVTGVAALLAEQHPDSTAAELVPTLMGAAVPDPELGAFYQGAGLVDAERAIAQQVHTTPASLSMGIAQWPHDDTEPITTTLTYHNLSDEQVTLDISVTALGADGTPAPAGTFGVTPTTVTVAPGETSDVTVTADTSTDSPHGTYSGWVIGDAGDGTVVTTPVGVVKEVESYDLTINTIDRNGEPTWTLATLGDLTAEVLRHIPIDEESVTLRLPAGRYDLNGPVTTVDVDDPNLRSTTLVAHPEINLDRDLSLTLDARQGRLVQAIVDSPTAKPSFRRAALGTYLVTTGVIANTESDELYATPTFEVTSYDYAFIYQSALSEPVGDAWGRAVRRPRGYQLYLTDKGRIPDPTFRVRDAQLARLDTTLHSQGVPDDRVAQLRARPHPEASDWPWDQSYDVSIPSERIDLYSAGPSVRWATEVDDFETAELDYYDLFVNTYEPGRRYDKQWNAAPLGPLARPVFAHNRLWVTLRPFSSSSHRHSTTPGWDGIEISTTLKKDGELVGISNDPDGGVYELPEEAAAYEVSMTAQRNVSWSTLATHVDATWTVTAGPDDNGRLPLLALRVSGDVDLLNQLPSHRPTRLEVQVERADGRDPSVRNVDLDVSFDDGTTWHSMRLRPAGSSFIGRTPVPPRGSEYVSLRASAKDPDGSGVEQTVIRAYKLTKS